MSYFIDPPSTPLSWRSPKLYALEMQTRLQMISDGSLPSIPEWTPLTAEEREPYLGERRSKAMLYSPRIDLAVGPFATNGSRAEEFDWLLVRHRRFIKCLLDAHLSNAAAFPETYSVPSFNGLQHTNPNPRCLIAIEIEKGNRDMKYLLGSATLAASWGKIGVVIGWSEERLRSLMGIREALSLQDHYGKNVACPNNLLVVSKEQMEKALHYDTQGTAEEAMSETRRVAAK